MNCKQGDLAIIVKSLAGNEGKIVRCVRLHDSMDTDVDGRYTILTGPRWIIDRSLPGVTGGGCRTVVYSVPDANLRPIKPLDESDEISQLVDISNLLAPSA